ncbi:hypothetical protein NIES593_15165 [Hydrococcus rivularis NIES-593]|uniref:DUF1816 domain-containing protein n=1 Tax=Hydrococcus rivularis NIES-593 TaxID=1921803 RepID=A0A1U7HD98_9CYAN|nr:DUF1816 domain-containing protein [Hydrococcus rivularis]OKH21556.1 hypothetical protein NIES593_15165 [Hydrococcus rivularis NIES-593]
MHGDNLSLNPLSAIADPINSDSSIDGKYWWVEIVTVNPQCIYYFGPFQSSQEAQTMGPGYIEDLQAEGAKEIQASIKYCNPKRLTIFEGESC